MFSGYFSEKKEISLRLADRQAVLLLSSAALLLCAGTGGSESYKLTTYYPAPYASYRSLRTSGKTMLAKNGDFVEAGKSGSPENDRKMRVFGPIEITGNGTAGGVIITGPQKTQPAAPLPGAIKWENGEFWGCCSGGTWFRLISSDNITRYKNNICSGGG